MKLEKALLDLSEHQNNFYTDKSGFDKQIDQAQSNTDTRIRQTFYGQGIHTGGHQMLNSGGINDPSTINSSNYYKPIGYSTGTRFRPSTQDNSMKPSSIAGEGLVNGDILSNIDNISNDELKERLIVSEMILKKLYTRNKDLETAIDKASIKIKETKRNTQQNFFKNTVKETANETNGFPKVDQTIEAGVQENEDSGSEVEIEIGCKDCEKYQEKEIKLNKELDIKIKHIFNLEQKVN